MIVYNDLENRITYVFNGDKAQQLRAFIIQIQDNIKELENEKKA